MKDRRAGDIRDRFQFGSFGIAEIARLRGVSASTVRNDVKSGVLPTFRHGRRRLARGVDAQRYLRAGEATPGSAT